MKQGPKKQVVSQCPFCGGVLSISRMCCGGCDTQIDSKLPIPAFFRLPDDLQEFAVIFLKCRGSIRDAEKELGISYPTVCKRLDQVNVALGNIQSAAVDRTGILGQLERGEITAKEAAQRLQGKGTL